MWGCYNDCNGRVTEALMESINLVCLNDGRGRRINIRSGTESAIDLTLASDSLAGICSWEMLTDSIIGNDHYLITVEECYNLEQYAKKEYRRRFCNQ